MAGRFAFAAIAGNETERHAITAPRGGARDAWYVDC
jgi:hypothetical protein